MKQNNGFSIAVAVLIAGMLMHGSSEAGKSLHLNQARELFYSAVDDGKVVDKAVLAFTSLEDDSNSTGLALTYLGALEALKGKHSFWPHNKLKHVKKGLRMMDEGIKADPTDLESHFVRGSTCHFLPGFFNRQDTAKADFLKIIELLPEEKHKYGKDMINGMIDFIWKNFEMTDAQKAKLQAVKMETIDYEN